MTNREIEQTVRKILTSQLFGVLATTGRTGPHSTIVSFASADDLTTIVFSTPRDSRKFENLKRGTNVSFFVDDRSLHDDKLLEIHGIEARGVAWELDNDERGQYEQIYLSKHPDLENFSSEAALIRIRVDRFDIVHRFQNVLVFKPGAGR